ncbi:MAG: HEXXH motif-containing protein [Bradymonadia bacterium]|jgi:HEXXH motif-containing protein
MALPIRPPSDLTFPADAEASTSRELLSTYLKLQYRTLLRLPYPALLGVRRPGEEFAELVRSVAKENPGFLFNVLRQPSVGGLLRLIATQAGNRLEMRDWTLQLIAQVNTELATVGMASSRLAPRGGFERLVSLHERFSIDISGAKEVHFDGDQISIVSLGQTETYDATDPAGARVARPYHEIRGQIVLPTYDNNPRAGEEAHPDKKGNHVDLGGKPVSEWLNTMQAAFAIIEEFASELIPEMELLLHQIFPVGYEPEKHLSASLMTVLGNIYMTLHPDPLVMAEAIIHEFSHNKINALWSLSPLLENAFEPLFSSPVRPDPRPLFGVLLAVHAFLPVEQMYLRMIEANHPLVKHPRFMHRRNQIRESNNAAATTVLDNGIATEMGGEVLLEIRRLNDRFAAA